MGEGFSSELALLDPPNIEERKLVFGSAGMIAVVSKLQSVKKPDVDSGIGALFMHVTHHRSRGAEGRSLVVGVRSHVHNGRVIPRANATGMSTLKKEVSEGIIYSDRSNVAAPEDTTAVREPRDYRSLRS